MENNVAPHAGQSTSPCTMGQPEVEPSTFAECYEKLQIAMNEWAHSATIYCEFAAVNENGLNIV